MDNKMSHHSMSTFFSGTDLSTLQSEGLERNNFVSLIVNNEGSYSAAITRKVQKHQTVQEENIFTFFGNEKGRDSKSYILDEDVIEFYMLDIDRQIPENSLSYLDTRFEEIKNNKKAVAEIARAKNKISTVENSSPWLPKPAYSKAGQLPFENKKTSLFEEYNETFPEKENLIQINPVLARSVTVKMLLCSFLANTSKVDMEKFITNNMQQVYDHFFENAESLKFCNYVDWVTDYLVSCSCPPDEDETLWATSMALAMQQVLIPYEKANSYIQVYMDALDSIILQEI